MLGFHVFFAFLAALGLFTLLWGLMGFFLPGCQNGFLLCTRVEFVPVYLWLRGFGIVTCPLVVLEERVSAQQRRALLKKEIAVHSREELLQWLGKDIP